MVEFWMLILGFALVFGINKLVKFCENIGAARKDTPNKRAQEPKKPKKITSNEKKRGTTAIFSVHFNFFIKLPYASGCSKIKPITAAYLFVIFDYIAMAHGKRDLSYEVLSTIEAELLSESELKCYDQCVNLFGAVMRGEIKPRGDWQYFDGETINCLHALFLCYGDLIQFPSYISDYKNHPIIIKDIFEQKTFVENFSSPVLNFTEDFINEIEDKM